MEYINNYYVRVFLKVCLALFLVFLVVPSYTTIVLLLLLSLEAIFLLSGLNHKQMTSLYLRRERDTIYALMILNFVAVVGKLLKII